MRRSFFVAFAVRHGLWGEIVEMTSMVVEMVPIKGGLGGIVHPPIGRKNATYIPLIYCLRLGDI